MQGFNRYFQSQSKLLIQKANNLENRAQRRFAYHATVLTIYGFQVAVPVILGVLAGHFLDKKIPVSHISWTLNLILIGFICGLYNANVWFYKNIGLKQKKGGKK